MGYTHYWRSRATHIPGAAVRIIREILDQAYAARLIQLEHDDPRPPVVSDTEIRFNGRGEDAHETFFFTANSQPFEFCKTARKPYDSVVMEVLIVLKFYLGGKIKVTSDGNLIRSGGTRGLRWKRSTTFVLFPASGFMLRKRTACQSQVKNLGLAATGIIDEKACICYKREDYGR